MGAWSADSKTHVASMESGDFTEVKYPLLLLNPLMLKSNSKKRWNTTVLKKYTSKEGEIIDSSVMNLKSLKFVAKTIAEAKKLNVLLSVHLKATMMKYQIQLF
jgi:isocitrate dehydrogenase